QKKKVKKELKKVKKELQKKELLKNKSFLKIIIKSIPFIWDAFFIFTEYSFVYDCFSSEIIWLSY
ncbi:MAG: hypothetical protein ACI9EK_002030, partial [Psychroserpens sp.]